MKHLFAVAEMIANAHLGKPGVDLFVGTIPADVVRGVMLIDPLTGHEIDEGLRGFFSTQFEIVARDPDADVAYSRVENLVRAITSHQVNVAGVSIAWLRPATLPISYPRSEGDAVEVAVRMRIGFNAHGN